MTSFDLATIFDLTVQDRKTPQERALKLSEEAGEVAQAILSSTDAPGSAYKNLTLDDVREEAADAAIVALSLVAQTCETQEQFLIEVDALLASKCRKWQGTLES